ncbi:MAG: hypothetical protein ACK4M9_22440 [Anaerobacillus sp.]|uniref:hypothetical protein n=1 Tax=Anaerobacillus sp. TaxID=1872506 RepID=UPI003918DF3A
MTKRGAGVAFIAIAAFLLAMKYITAAIFGSGVLSWDAGLFNAMLQYVGNTLNTFSFLALIVGIAYLAWGEYEEFGAKKKR